MVWVTTVLILGFGAITLYLRDPKFIQMKPTIIYVGFAVLLGAGLLKGKALLKWLFGPVFPGLTEEGWLKLTRNWALFFAFMAVLNETVWRNSSTQFWIGFKIWGAIPLTFLFAAANIPMLLRHGLLKEDAVPAEPGPVE